MKTISAILAGVVFSCFLVACGGGSSTDDANVWLQAHPAAKNDGPFASMAAATPHRAATARAPDATSFFVWAELAYPNLFGSSPSNQMLDVWTYRYYPKTDIYLGVNKTGDVLGLAGKGDGGYNSFPLGKIADYGCQVYPTDCVSANQAEIALVNSVKNAQNTVDILGTSLRASAIYRPASSSSVATESVNGTSACTGCTASINIPESSQAGSFMLFEVATPAVDMATIKISRIVAIMADKPVDIPLAANGILWQYGNTGKAIIQLPNGIAPNYLAAEVQTSATDRIWLAAKLMPTLAAYRLYSQGEFSGDVIAPYYQQVLRYINDYSGGGSSIASILLKFGAQVSESDAMDGMMKYGVTENIIARQGFSLLDMKRYLQALGIASAAYKTDETDDLRQALAEKNSAIIMGIKILGQEHFAILVGVDQQYVYIASPVYGKVAVPLADFLDVGRPQGSFIIFVASAPDNWSYSILTKFVTS